MAVVDDVVRSSAVCASEFGREDDGEVKGVGRKSGSDLSRVKLASRVVEPVRAYLSQLSSIGLPSSPSLSPSSSQVRSITSITRFGEAKICLTEWRSLLSSPESKISPSSESSAEQAGGSGWPTAGGAGTSIADRLKRAAQPNIDASEGDGGFKN